MKGDHNDMDKKDKTPSPFEKVDVDGPQDVHDGLQPNGIIQNGIKEDPNVYV